MSGGPIEKFVLRHAFTVVDAAVDYMFLSLEQLDPTPEHRIRHERRQRTTGGATYIMSVLAGEEAAWMVYIDLRDVGKDKTFLQIEAASPYHDDPGTPGLLQRVRWWVHQWIEDEATSMEDLAKETKLPDIPEFTAKGLFDLAIAHASRAGGRPRQSTDDWAWAQIHLHHRPPATVRAEWNQRNADEDRFLKDEDRTWRHAIDPNRMKKLGRRKPE